MRRANYDAFLVFENMMKIPCSLHLKVKVFHVSKKCIFVNIKQT